MVEKSLQPIQWNDEGLIPVITQEAASGLVLMHAWMNSDALQQTLKEGVAHYWSRSRKKLWKKGESSGHTQQVKEIRLDCDGDTLLLKVEQKGGIACHTGRHHCFYRQWDGQEWQLVEPILKSSDEIYKNHE